jgi:hypothetical protein
MKGLGMRTKTLDKVRSARLKAQRKKSGGKSSLSEKEPTSGSEESAAVHHAQMSLLSFSDGVGKGDNDSVVVKTVETLSVVGSDVPTLKQEKEARSSGGFPSR